MARLIFDKSKPSTSAQTNSIGRGYLIIGGLLLLTSSVLILLLLSKVPGLESAVKFWPAVLILIGLMISANPTTVAAGLVVILLGAYIGLTKLGILSSFASTAVDIIMIGLLGIVALLLFKHKGGDA